MKSAKTPQLASNKPKRTWWTIGLACLALTSALAANNALQNTPADTVTMAPEIKTLYLRLNAAKPSLKQKIVVPAGMDALNITLGADPDIKFVLLTPDGDVFPTETPEAFNGTFSTSTAENGIIYSKMTLNHPHTGAYVLELSTATPKTPNSLAVLEYTIDGKRTPEGLNTPSSALKIDYSQVEGQPILMTVAADAAGLPLASEATVEIVNNLADGTQHSTTVKLHDDGNNATGDAKAGDGLYSTFAPALPPTSYMAFSKLSAMVGAEKLELSGFGMFVVYEKTARITPKIVEEIAQDDNGDGLIDSLVFKVPVEAVWREGPSWITGALEGSNGNVASGRIGQAGLTKDMKFATFTVSTEEIRKEIGVDGPYKIIQFRNMWQPSEPNGQHDGISAHMVQDIGDMGYTKAYRIKDFSRPYIDTNSLHMVSERGIDTNGNGLFDQIGITVSFESAVDFVNSPDWVFDAELQSFGGDDNDHRLVSKRPKSKIFKGINQIELIFDVREFGLNGEIGPFEVTNFNLHPETPTEGNQDYDFPTLGPTKTYPALLEGSKTLRKVGGGITSSATITAARTKTLLAGATLTPNDPSVTLPDVPALAAKAARICDNTVSTVPSIIATPAQFDQLFIDSNCAVVTGNLVVNQGVLLKNKRLILDANSSVTFNGALTLKDSVIVAGNIAIKGVLNAENSRLYALNPMGSFTLCAGSSLFGISTIASAGGINNVGSFSASSTAFADVAFIAGKSILSNSIKGKAIFWSGGPLIVSGDIDLIGALYAKGMINIGGNTKLTLERRSLNGDLPLE